MLEVQRLEPREESGHRGESRGLNAVVRTRSRRGPGVLAPEFAGRAHAALTFAHGTRGDPARSACLLTDEDPVPRRPRVQRPRAPLRGGKRAWSLASSAWPSWRCGGAAAGFFLRR